MRLNCASTSSGDVNVVTVIFSWLKSSFPLRESMVARKPAMPTTPSKKDLEAMSEFRYRLRRFLRFSEEATHAAGITPLQYQLLLQVAGFPGRTWATIGELAERLQAAPNGTAALVSRCESAGLVTRKPGKEDRRQVCVHLTAAGERCLLSLAALHKPEIEGFGWAFGELNTSSE